MCIGGLFEWLVRRGGLGVSITSYCTGKSYPRNGVFVFSCYHLCASFVSVYSINTLLAMCSLEGRMRCQSCCRACLYRSLIPFVCLAPSISRSTRHMILNPSTMSKRQSYQQSRTSQLQNRKSHSRQEREQQPLQPLRYFHTAQSQLLDQRLIRNQSCLQR
jgi:hypothetical protein